MIDLAAYILFIFIISCLNCCPFCFSFGYLRCGLLAWCPGVVTRKNLHLARLSLVWRIGVVSWCRDAEPSSFGAALWRGLRWRHFWPHPHPVNRRRRLLCVVSPTTLGLIPFPRTHFSPATQTNAGEREGKGNRKCIALPGEILYCCNHPGTLSPR